MQSKTIQTSSKEECHLCDRHRFIKSYTIMASSSSQPVKGLPANPPKVSSEDIISQKVGMQIKVDSINRARLLIILFVLFVSSPL